MSYSALGISQPSLLSVVLENIPLSLQTHRLKADATSLPLIVYLKRFSKSHEDLGLDIADCPQVTEALIICWELLAKYDFDKYYEFCKQKKREIFESEPAYLSSSLATRFRVLSQQLYHVTQSGNHRLEFSQYLEKWLEIQQNVAVAVIIVAVLIQPFNTLQNCLDVLFLSIHNQILLATIIRSLCACTGLPIVAETVIHSIISYSQRTNTTKTKLQLEKDATFIISYVASYELWLAAVVRDYLSQKQLFRSVCIQLTARVLNDSVGWINGLLQLNQPSHGSIELKSHWIFCSLTKAETSYFGKETVRTLQRHLSHDDDRAVLKESLLAQLVSLLVMGLSSTESLIAIDCVEVSRILIQSISDDEMPHLIDWIFAVITFQVGCIVSLQHVLATAISTSANHANGANASDGSCCIGSGCSLLCSNSFAPKPCRHVVSSGVIRAMEACYDCLKLCFQRLDELQCKMCVRHKLLQLYWYIMVQFECPVELCRYISSRLGTNHITDLFGGECTDDFLRLTSSSKTPENDGKANKPLRDREKEKSFSEPRLFNLPTIARLPNMASFQSLSTELLLQQADSSDSCSPSVKYLFPLTSSAINAKTFRYLQSIPIIPQSANENPNRSFGQKADIVLSYLKTMNREDAFRDITTEYEYIACLRLVFGCDLLRGRGQAIDDGFIHSTMLQLIQRAQFPVSINLQCCIDWWLLRCVQPFSNVGLPLLPTEIRTGISGTYSCCNSQHLLKNRYLARSHRDSDCSNNNRCAASKSRGCKNQYYSAHVYAHRTRNNFFTDLRKILVSSEQQQLYVHTAAKNCNLFTALGGTDINVSWIPSIPSSSSSSSRALTTNTEVDSYKTSASCVLFAYVAIQHALLSRDIRNMIGAEILFGAELSSIPFRNLLQQVLCECLKAPMPGNHRLATVLVLGLQRVAPLTLLVNPEALSSKTIYHVLLFPEHQSRIATESAEGAKEQQINNKAMHGCNSSRRSGEIVTDLASNKGYTKQLICAWIECQMRVLYWMLRHDESILSDTNQCSKGISPASASHFAEEFPSDAILSLLSKIGMYSSLCTSSDVVDIHQLFLVPFLCLCCIRACRQPQEENQNDSTDKVIESVMLTVPPSVTKKVIELWDNLLLRCDVPEAFLLAFANALLEINNGQLSFPVSEWLGFYSAANRSELDDEINCESVRHVLSLGKQLLPHRIRIETLSAASTDFPSQVASFMQLSQEPALLLRLHCFLQLTFTANNARKGGMAETETGIDEDLLQSSQFSQNSESSSTAVLHEEQYEQVVSYHRQRCVPVAFLANPALLYLATSVAYLCSSVSRVDAVESVEARKNALVKWRQQQQQHHQQQQHTSSSGNVSPRKRSFSTDSTGSNMSFNPFFDPHTSSSATVVDVSTTASISGSVDHLGTSLASLSSTEADMEGNDTTLHKFEAIDAKVFIEIQELLMIRLVSSFGEYVSDLRASSQPPRRQQQKSEMDVCGLQAYHSDIDVEKVANERNVRLLIKPARLAVDEILSSEVHEVVVSFLQVLLMRNNLLVQMMLELGVSRNQFQLLREVERRVYNSNNSGIISAKTGVEKYPQLADINLRVMNRILNESTSTQFYTGRVVEMVLNHILWFPMPSEAESDREADQSMHINSLLCKFLFRIILGLNSHLRDIDTRGVIEKAEMLLSRVSAAYPLLVMEVVPAAKAVAAKGSNEDKRTMQTWRQTVLRYANRHTELSEFPLSADNRSAVDARLAVWPTLLPSTHSASRASDEASKSVVTVLGKGSGGVKSKGKYDDAEAIESLVGHVSKTIWHEGVLRYEDVAIREYTEVKRQRSLSEPTRSQSVGRLKHRRADSQDDEDSDDQITCEKGLMDGKGEDERALKRSRRVQERGYGYKSKTLEYENDYTMDGSDGEAYE